MSLTAASIHAPAAGVRTCPDCGGILQSLEPEPLTSAEVAAHDSARRARGSQCLICGYQDAGTRTAAAPDR